MEAARWGPWSKEGGEGAWGAERRSHRGRKASSRTLAPLPHFKPEQLCFDLYYVFLFGCKISPGQRNLYLKKVLETITVGAGEPWKGLEQGGGQG